MKRISAVFLSVTMLFLSLAGCDSQANGAGRDEEDGSISENEAALASNVSDDPSSDDNTQIEFISSEDAAVEEVLPVIAWETDSPENHGMDGELLRALHAALEGSQINSIVIIKDSYLVDEYYQGEYDEDSIFRMNSCSKSFTSTLIGIAIDEGLIAGVDVPISEYFPQLVGTDKEGITIRHLLEHTSGIQWYEFGGSATSFWELNSADNWVDYVLSRPMEATPGSTFIYSTGGTHLLAAILKQVIDVSLFEYAEAHIFAPLGMDSVQWRADPQGILDGGNGIEMTTRDAAKFGQLFLNGGSWNDRQLVPAEWVRESTDVQVPRSGNYGSYGYQWWIRRFGAYDAYYAMGAMGQFILVVPELDLVTAISSKSSGSTDAPYAYISDYILAACNG